MTTIPRESMFAKPKRKHDDVFILKPENNDFAAGDTHYRPKDLALLNDCTALFMLPFVFVGIFMIGYMLTQWRTYVQLSIAGVSTSAVVTERYTGEDEGTTYYLRFRFTARAIAYENRATVNDERYATYVEGSEITVRYLPNDPNTVRPVWSGDNFPGFELAMTGFALVWNTLVFSTIYGMLMNTRKLQRLRAAGIRLPGIIVKAHGHNGEDGFVVTVHYQFSSPDGVTFTGKESGTRDDLDKDLLPLPNTAVMVIYADARTYAML